MEGGNGKREKGCQGTCSKGHMNKAKMGQDPGWDVGKEKWRQLYLNNNKILKNGKKTQNE